MKRGKRLTRKQKECLTENYLKADDWMLIKETEFYLKIIHKKTNERRSIDKFRKAKNEQSKYNYSGMSFV